MVVVAMVVVDGDSYGGGGFVDSNGGSGGNDGGDGKCGVGSRGGSG